MYVHKYLSYLTQLALLAEVGFMRRDFRKFNPRSRSYIHMYIGFEFFICCLAIS